MNSRKSKSKKRKLSDLEEASEDDSIKKAKDIGLESNEESSGGEDGIQEGSSSDVSDSSSESQSSSSSSSSSNIKALGKSKASRPNILSTDSSSESGDETCEKCAICLRSITSQEVGNPEVCDHLFCSVCIIEWSKNSNVCPLDRQQFSIILVRENKEGSLIKKVAVEEPQAVRVDNVELEELDDTVCEICGSGDREDIMLLCDICDRGFHTVCLTPPLENIPDEYEWFCPDCDYRAPNRNVPLLNNLEQYLDNAPITYLQRTLRPRMPMVRTRLLERIRVTVNRIVENYVLQHPDYLETSEDELLSESGGSIFTSESDFVVSDEQPSTSGVQITTAPLKKKAESKTRQGRVMKSVKRSGKRSKRSTKTTRNRKTTKRKTTGGAKKRTKRRKTKVATTRTKKVKVENEDGTVTEKIVKTKTYKRRRQKRKKKKVKAVGGARKGLRVKSVMTPKTVKGRLAVTLGMVPPKKSGQLLPDIKIRPTNSPMSSIDLNRARAGIPKLHIFGPRDELQYYSSDSDHEDFIGSSSGGVATVAQQRTNLSRIRDRKKAALVLQSMPSSTASKPKPVTEPPSSEYVDILGSILDSQAIWHSKNTNVKIKEDGSIEVIKDTKSDDSNFKKTPKSESSKTIDVREGTTDGMTTQAPMYPGSGSRPGGFRPYNRSGYGDSRPGQDNVFSQRSGQSSAGVNFNRFGGPPRNDREGYTNYLNNIPQGPAPFCRGGPPLRFRMPARQQLRRIPFPPRNRPLWQSEEEEDENGNENEKNDEKREYEDGNGRTEESKVQDEEDIDLYSDIETNIDKTDNSGPEDGSSSYPALGPPPEPSAFLLGLDENEDFAVVENKDKSEVYDPAEPCDSEDEMVIVENQERSSTPEQKNKEEESSSTSASPKTNEPPKPSSWKTSSGDDDEDCPSLSIYSSATREFSQKEEEEREREIAGERRKLEEMKLQKEKNTKKDVMEPFQEEKETLEVESKPESVDEQGKAPEPDAENLSPSSQKDDKKKEKSKENVCSRLSFDFAEEKVLSQEESSRSPSAKSGREGSRSRSKSVGHDKENVERRSSSRDSKKRENSKSSCSAREKSSSPERKTEKYRRTKRKSKSYESETKGEVTKVDEDRKSDDDDDDDEDDDYDDDDKENEGTAEVADETKDDEKPEKALESESETVSQKVATGLEGLDVEEVSSDNGDSEEFGDKRSLSSLSLSELSNRSKRSKSPVQLKKKKKNKKRKAGKSKSGKSYEEGEIDDSEKDNRLDESKNENDEIGNENSPKTGEKRRGRKSASTGSERQVLGSKENKKVAKEKSKDKDLSWKKPSKKEKNYREGKKRSKDRGRSKSNERRKSKSLSPKKDKKKNKDRKKKADKKKDIERYDVRKIVKNKEVRKTDAFGRDIVSKSRSISRSRSRSQIRERSRNMLRRDSRSFTRSRSRSLRRGRSPVRRRYIRSRTRSRTKSVRRSYSRSRSRSRSRKLKKKVKSKDRLKARSRSRGRKSRSLSRGRRSLSRSRSRSPVARVIRSKKATRSRRSWSHHVSRSPSFSTRRSRSVTRSPIRVRRSYSRSISTSWSRGRSPLPRTSSLEKLTVVLTTKDKKKWKKKKEGKRSRKEEKRRKKTGNSKEVFASGDNVLVSVNFRNNNNTGNNSTINNDGRNTRLNSLSPGPEGTRKKRRGSDYENERISKKSKKSNPISKKVVDVALSNACPKRAKKLTRLSEKDAEVILNRKPVAVIDLDMSPYREQTPSPVNVVVVSDSGSGDEGKEHTPQRQTMRGTPGMEVEKTQENVGGQSVTVSAPSSPLENGYVPTSGPKTPPEPQIKFSISKPQQLRQIANPLGDDDDDEVDEEEGEQRVESLDRRIEKELNPRSEVAHKGPNTPPAPRGPSTPKTPPSPQTSPDAYDPFEPTKSRSPSPSQADKENRPSPKSDVKDDQASGSVQGETVLVSNSIVDNADKVNDVILENHDDKITTVDKGEAIPVLECSSNVVISNQATGAPASDIAVNESPERKITVVITTPQNKTQAPTIQKTYTPVLKQLPIVSAASVQPPTSVNLTVSSDVFSMPSPTKTSRTNTTTTTQSLQITGIQRLQHRLGSPVNRTPNSVKSTPEKRSTPRTETNEIFTSGNYMIRNVSKRNGEQPKQPRPLQDATNETIDITMDMDDSPYSPASSEGDDLFDPPVETSKPSQSNSKPAPSYKGVPKPTHKSPVKQLNKFDLLFGISGPTLSPLKVGNKKTNAKVTAKAPVLPKVIPPKTQKKVAGTTKKNMHKMDEDQLRILDELPSSAVELQVKDKFLKKLNRQERVVDEVKTVLKPHYARKHITKEEYKDILRRSVPKICHSRSGEINPSKIQSLIEAYVRKFRHAKKKGTNITAKPKVKKTMFS